MMISLTRDEQAETHSEQISIGAEKIRMHREMSDIKFFHYPTDQRVEIGTQRTGSTRCT